MDALSNYIERTSWVMFDKVTGKLVDKHGKPVTNPKLAARYFYPKHATSLMLRLGNCNLTHDLASLLVVSPESCKVRRLTLQELQGETQ